MSDFKLISVDINGVQFDPEQGYDLGDLSGIDFTIYWGASAGAGETDITSISNIIKYWNRTGRDFRYAVRALNDFITNAGGFASLSDSDKLLIAQNSALLDSSGIDRSTLSTYWQGSPHNLSASDADKRVLDLFFSVLLRSVSDSIPTRTAKARRVLYTYLGDSDVMDLLIKLRDIGLFQLWSEHGILGKSYHSSVDGIMDFFEGTSTYLSPDAVNYLVDGNLESFVSGKLLTGSYTNLRDDLIEALVNDNLTV